MAVFKKFLSATKNKMKASNIKVKGGPGTSCTQEDEEEFEARKHEWQEELDQMSEFLILKSTEEQKDDGVDQPVDTAYIDDRDGMPMLKAVFDVHHFKPEEVQLSVEEGQLTLIAQCLDDRESAVFKKTMIRKVDLPKYVDHKMMHCDLDPTGVLTIEMPFHLPPQRRPQGPSVVPIVDDGDGSRKIRLSFFIGPDFTADDVRVEKTGQRLVVTASYDAEIGVYGFQVTQREFRKELRLPEHCQVERVEHSLTAEGKLHVDLILRSDRPYKCQVTTEELPPTSPEDVDGDDDDEEDAGYL